MSSSRQNGRPTNRGRRFVPPASGWKCPECGEQALIRVKKSYRLHDGVVIPKLDRLQCQSCKSNFFDPYALDAIEEFRKSHPYKKSMAKRPKADKKAIAA
jgi:predicted RNA-binding Zn-ribbon protein involved in translation (DUF1610 family)